MDIRINALGRSVEIIDVDCEVAQDCTAVALELWQSLVPTVEDETGGAFTIQTERNLKEVGFVSLSEGERPAVK